MNPYAPPAETPPKPHPFYTDRKPQGMCKHCGKPILKDRWTDSGWAHYTSGEGYCYAPPNKAEPT